MSLIRHKASIVARWGELLGTPGYEGVTMADSSYFREQAERCRRLARDSTDPALQVNLRRLADEYDTHSNEMIDQEIAQYLPFGQSRQGRQR